MKSVSFLVSLSNAGKFVLHGCGKLKLYLMMIDFPNREFTTDTTKANKNLNVPRIPIILI